MVQFLGKSEATEDSEVADCWLAPMPGLIRCLDVEGLSGRAVEHMDRGHDRFSAVDGWHPSRLEKGLCGGHHHLVAVLETRRR